MKSVQRKDTKPYCVCSKERSEGWSLFGTYWVHPACGKVSRAVWERQAGLLGFFP